ncbi:hypothetical protein Vadar_008004 [Vaccinium darrowii]|uniref:Uncharacterized protein n=1 Tax=Vaccinium darrowii TaxID=229202 RepID=A0ACB7XXZ6_9ERIC|nr:hypothetical protein Vadar_008004 [Vaccinium darrowii]
MGWQSNSKAPTTVEELVQNTDSPLTVDVMRVPLPRKFKMPQIDIFNGSTDPLDHLKTYKSLMMLQAKYSKPSTYLFLVKQGRNKSLRGYTNRFTKESMQAEAIEDKISTAAYIAGLYSEDALNARRSRDDNLDSQFYQIGQQSHNDKRKRDQVTASQVNLDGVLGKTNTAKGEDYPPSYFGRRGQLCHFHD